MDDIQRYVEYANTLLSKLYKNPKELDFANSIYYRINHMLLLSATLWPYEHSKLTNIMRVFILSMTMSMVLVQITPFFTYEYSVDFFIMTLSYILIGVLTHVQYYFFFFNFDKMKQIWRNICENWNNLKNEAECSIMRRYSFISELITICVALLLGAGFVGYASMPFLPLALDIILPLNEPRPRPNYAITEYFIDSETYYYPILFHWLLGLFLGGLVVIAAWTFLLAYIYHICGLLKIAGYADFLMSTIQSLGLATVILGGVIVCLNWLRLLRAMIAHDIDNIIPTITIVFGCFFLLLLASYCGQQVTDHNNEIFGYVYNIRWYMAAIKIQKLLLFIMKRTTKPYTLNVANIIKASIEDFGKFFNVSMSYLMIIYSLMMK